MNQLQAAFHKLDVEEMGQVGDPFDPNIHNAISHIETRAWRKTPLCRCLKRAIASATR